MSWIEDPGIANFKGFNISSLKIDEAWINVTSLVGDGAMWLYELSSDCHKVTISKLIGLLTKLYKLAFYFAVSFPKEVYAKL